MKKNKKLEYEKKTIATIVEVAYSDGKIRYDLEGIGGKEGHTCGLFNEIDLFIELLVLMGKISRPTVYVSN